MLWEKWSRVFIPDPGVKKAADPGSLIRIRNTACNGCFYRGLINMSIVNRSKNSCVLNVLCRFPYSSYETIIIYTRVDMSRQFSRQQRSSYIFLYTFLKHFLRLAIQDNMVQVCGRHIKSRVSKKFHFFFVTRKIRRILAQAYQILCYNLKIYKSCGRGPKKRKPAIFYLLCVADPDPVRILNFHINLFTF
jgi:hypothetical protein